MEILATRKPMELKQVCVIQLSFPFFVHCRRAHALLPRPKTEFVASVNIAPKHTGKVPTDQLDFDPNNPRLVEDGIKNPTDAEVILSLADMADLSEVVESIAANGYIDIEPLIGQKVCRPLARTRRQSAACRHSHPAKASPRKRHGCRRSKISAENMKTLKEVTVYAVAKPRTGAGIHRLQAHQRASQVGCNCERAICSGLVSQGKRTAD